MMTSLRVLAFAAIAIAASTSFAGGGAGFKPFFNGKDLTGWNMADKKSNTKAGESLAGKTATPNDRFRVEKEMLVIDGLKKGDTYIVSDVKFSPKNCHIKFDFLPGPKCNNDILLLGIKFDFKTSDVKGCKDGEWNAFEIVVKDGAITLLCNGTAQKVNNQKINAKISDPTPLTLRAEFGAISYKNFVYKQD